MSAGLFLVAAALGAPSYQGRTPADPMDASGAPWLTRPQREQEEASALLLRKLGLKRGQTACDVGAGNGYHSLQMATAVGPNGKVLATDIQPAMLALLRQRARTAGITNIETLDSTPTDAALPAGACDVILLVDVYHEFSDPEAMLRGLRAALKPKGRIALVEYRAEDPAVPIKPLHKMTVEQCDREYVANGFVRVGRFDGLPWQHLLFYGVPAP